MFDPKSKFARGRNNSKGLKPFLEARLHDQNHRGRKNARAEVLGIYIDMRPGSARSMGSITCKCRTAY